LNLPAAAVGIGAGLLLLAGFLTPFAGATLAILNTSIALFWIAPVHSAPNSLFVAAVDAGRHRERTHRPGHSRTKPPKERPIRKNQLRGHARRSARKRTVRT
jgi:hypothetical protein